MWGRRQRGGRDASGCWGISGIVSNHEKLEKARKGPSLQHGMQHLACRLPASRTGSQKFTMILSHPCLWLFVMTALGDWHKGIHHCLFQFLEAAGIPSFLVPSSIFRISSDGVNPQVASLQPSFVTISYQSQEVFSDFKNSRFDSAELSGITQDNRPISRLVAPVTATKSPCH